VHLVVDVFEEYRPRTVVPAGSSCEYGNQLSLLQLISTIMQIAAQQGLDEQQVSEEIQLLLATAGGARTLMIVAHAAGCSACKSA
jgi:hypothetical protein